MNEDRAREVVEHLQTAALELIAAARAALDVAEDMVKDPPTTSLAGMAEAGRRASRPDAHRPHRVERIDVS